MPETLLVNWYLACPAIIQLLKSLVHFHELYAAISFCSLGIIFFLKDISHSLTTGYNDDK